MPTSHTYRRLIRLAKFVEGFSRKILQAFNDNCLWFFLFLEYLITLRDIFKWYGIRWFFRKTPHIFGLPKYRSPSLFPPN